MKIGVSGHQKRDCIDWDWVRISIRQILIENKVSTAFSSLAVGSDQIFAAEAIALGIPVEAVIPFSDYDRCFSALNLQDYRELLKKASNQIFINKQGDDERLFFEAGKKVCELSELMVFIWDGKPSFGKGGTADIVNVAAEFGRSFVWLNPILRERRDSFGPKQWCRSEPVSTF
ncbi:Hypothetical protein AT6N2_L0011 [Agrobacterium tumefaciens]|uniref:hypothetical protein n=1 Tax=Agrobacterium tumefaciens TaxID=358 RepID=UPI001AD98C4D|nr:hypothetical protein [Agrobacterium tumefaciens]QTK80996.1 Hypothetical protein AT6N2_L0011 [Agrobacterium tumefaciens]